MSVAPVEQGQLRAGELRITPIPVREPRPASRISLLEEAALGPEHLMLALPQAERRAAPPRRGSTAMGDVSLLLNPLDAAVPAERAAAVYPEPSAWATRFLLAALEVTHGIRPASQLVRWTTPEVHEALARRASLNGRLRTGRSTPAGAVSGALRVGTVLVCRPTPHACEVAAVVHDRDRVRAVALRLEGLGTRWRVTALQIG